MIYLRLFYEFCKTGLFAVGGGLATIPFLYELSEKTGWFTTQQLTDMIAISESTPGAMGVNMASYVGFTSAGIPGGIIAILGLITPSIIVILIIAKLLQKFRDNKYVTSAFYGLRPASVALIAAAGLEVIKISLFYLDNWQLEHSIPALLNYKSIILAVVIFFAMRKWKGHPILYLGISAVIGILFKFAS